MDCFKQLHFKAYMIFYKGSWETGFVDSNDFPFADVINRLGKQIQLSLWYILYGDWEDRGLLQCRAGLRAFPVGLREEQYLPGRAKSLWGWGLEPALRHGVFPGSLP